MKRYLLSAMLLVMVVSLSQALAAPDDAIGEARLWIQATFRGYYDYDWKDRGAGETAPAGVGSYRDRVTVVFSGTTTWRVMDMMIDPESMSQNCSIACEGGGSYSQVEKGVHWCGDPPADRPWVDTSQGSWRYSNPTQPQALADILSPAGVVNVAPMFGTWMFQASAYPNWNDMVRKGRWTQKRRYYCKCPATSEAHVIDQDNDVPGGTHAGSQAQAAYEATLGPDREAAEPFTGNFKPSDKGFFVSGRIQKHGGEPVHEVGEPPTGKPDDAYYTGTEGMWWTSDVQWTLSYNQKPPPVELIIEPVPGYDKWLPEAGSSETAPGNEMVVSTHLQVKGEPGKVPLQKGKFRFELSGVSNERGLAMNKPLQGGGTEPDLKLEVGTAADLTAKDSVAATISEELKAAYVKVRSYDFGAYGTLKVTATLEDGSVVYGHLDGQPGKEELSIPLDTNNNHIADPWEDKEGILKQNLPANWDAQKVPALGGQAGDGLSLYEEYRGLAHRDGILRLSAAQKNLVVENRYGDQAKPGLQLFQDASQIKVAELDEGELPEDRVVNLNRGTASGGGAQHGLLLVPEGLSAGDIGKAWPDRVKTCPAECERVAINSNLSFLPAANHAALLAVGVAHELGHALGAQHHGDSPTELEDFVVADPATEITGVDGRPITGRPFPLEGATETRFDGGQSSGEENCLMRYSSFFQWVRQLTRNGTFHYYVVPPTAPGDRFCASSAGSGLNAAGNTPCSYFGNAADGRGACLTHMRVRDY